MMKGDWVSHVDHDAKTMTFCAGTEIFALQYQAEGQWCWTCDAGGYVLGFTEEDLKRIGELPLETRRVPWADVPARLKRLSEVGNRKARRAERSERRREAWQAHMKAKAGHVVIQEDDGEPA